MYLFVDVLNILSFGNYSRRRKTMTKTVFKVRVLSKDMISDFMARFRSILGGRVKVYEKAISEAIEEAYNELITEYPNVTNVKFGTTEMLSDACEIIIYGDVTDEEYNEGKKKNKDRTKRGSKKV
jgi:uncharacterized protein YbjQ (UPF0145 family)